MLKILYSDKQVHINNSDNTFSTYTVVAKITFRGCELTN